MVLSGDIVSNGLQFHAVGLSTWDGSATTSEVQVGKAVGDPASFKPLIDIMGGFQISDPGLTTAQASTTTSGSKVRIYSAGSQSGAQLLYSGIDTFGIVASALTPTIGDGVSSAAIQGFPLTISSLSMADGASVQASGSVKVGGVVVTLPSGVTSTVSGTGASVPSFSLTLGGGTTTSLKGLDLSLGVGGSTPVAFTAGFDSNLQAFYIDGSAMFSFGGSSADPGEKTNTVGLTLGHPTATVPTHGLVFQNGDLASVDATINGDLAYRGLTFHLAGLGLAYSASGGGQYTVAGSASVDWAGGGTDGTKNTLGLTLGSATRPGIVIVGGALQSLDASINGSVNVKNLLTLSSTGLHLGYVAATASTSATFEVDGSATLTKIGGDAESTSTANTVTVALGNTSMPGLVVSGGDVKSFNVALTGTASLKGLNVAVTNLGAAYDVGSKSLTIDGSASISWGTGSEASNSIGVTLGNGKLGTQQVHGLVFQNGDLTSLYATVNASLTYRGLTFATNSTNPLGVEYDTTGQQIELFGGANLTWAVGGGGAIAATLETAGSPGILVKNGTLTKLDATLSGSVNVKDLVTISSTGLHLGYVAATASTSATFEVDGSATLTKIGGDAESTSTANTVTVALGNTSMPGLVVSGGDVKSFNVALTGTASLKGLNVAVTNLGAAYDVGSKSLTIDGSASVSWKTGGSANSVGVTLGNGKLGTQQVHGLVFQNGDLTSLYASLTGSIKVGSALMISANGLTLGYSSSSKTFTVDGSTSLSVGSDKTIQSVAVTLGDATTHGLSIVNGSLQSLAVSVTGTFGLGGVTISPNGLSFKYDATNSQDPTISLNGQLTANLTSTIAIGGGFTRPLVIHTNTGAVDLTSGFGIAIRGDFKGFTVDAMFLYAPHPGGGYDVTADGHLKLGDKFGFTAHLHMHDGKLADIGIGFDGRLELGDTGLFITWAYGSLNNLDSSTPLITAAVTMVYIDGNIMTISGAIEFDKNHLSLTMDPNHLPAIYTNGQVSIKDHPLGITLLDGVLGTFTGSVDLNWNTGVYMVHAHGELLDDLIDIDAGITITSAGNFTLTADGKINIPKDIPVIGGITLAAGHVRVLYLKGDPNDSFVAAWGDFFGGAFTAGLEYNMGSGNFSYLDSSAIASLPTGVAKPNSSGYVIRTYTIDIPNDSASAQFTISDPWLDENYPGLPGMPGGVIWQSANHVGIVAPPRYLYTGGHNGGFSLLEPKYTQATYSYLTPATIPDSDTIGSNPNPMYPRSSRVITILPEPGQKTLAVGTWTVSLYENNYDFGGNYALGQGVDTQLVTHLSAQPLSPTFGYLFAPGNTTATFKDTTLSASQTNLDTFHVAVPVDSYNPASGYSVKIYASNSPVNTSGDPNNPAYSGATLVSQQSFSFVPTPTDPQHSHTDFVADIPASALPTPPDGKTPVYFYVAIDDGLNHLHYSSPTPGITPPSLYPTISAPAGIVSDFKTPTTFSYNGANALQPSAVPSSSYGSTKVTLSRSDGYVFYSNTWGHFIDALYAGNVRYDATIFPSKTVAAQGFDAVTMTVTNTSASGNAYSTSATIAVLPANNVDLSTTQKIYGPRGELIADSTNASLSAAPAAEGATVTIKLAVTTNETAAGTAGKATGVTVNYAIPAGLTYVPTASSSAFDPVAGVWNVGDIPLGSSRTISLTATVNVGAAGTTTTSAATAVPNGQVDVNPSNQQSTTSFLVTTPLAGQVFQQITVGNASQTVPAPNVVVYLLAHYNASYERLLAATQTDASGRYSFAVPDPSTYTGATLNVRTYVTNSTAYTTDNIAVNPATDLPLFHTTTVQSATISGALSRAKYPSAASAPASYFSPKTGGVVYLDANNNGQFDDGEVSDVTDAAGNYQLTNLMPGVYTVRELLGPGRAPATTSGTITPGADAVSLSVAPGTTSTANFAYVDQRTIYSYEFNDDNGDGKFGPGESGQAGYTFSLYSVGIAATSHQQPFGGYYYSYASRLGGVVNTSVSDAGGMFHFDNLSPGYYQVMPTGTPAGATATQAERTSSAIFWVMADGTVATISISNPVLNPNTFKYSSGLAYTTYTNNPPIAKDVATLDSPYVGSASHSSGVNHFFDDWADFGFTAPQLTASSFQRAVATLPKGDSLQIAAPQTVRDGTLNQYSVSVLKPDGTIDTAFAGTIDLGSSDDQAQLPRRHTYSAADAGIFTFEASLDAVGTSTIEAEIDGQAMSDVHSDSITVLSGPAITCVVTGSASITPGQAFSLTLNPLDAQGHTARTYYGTAVFSESLAVDGVIVATASLPQSVRAWLAAGAGLPSSYKFTISDRGLHTLNLLAPSLSNAEIAAIPGMGGASPGTLTLVVHVTDPTGTISEADLAVPVKPAPATVSTPTPTPTPSR